MSFFSDHYRLKLALLFVWMLLCRFLSAPDAFLHPILFNEDGTSLFAYFLNNPGPGEIFQFYNGYVSLIPNLVGYAAVRVSVAQSPYLLAFYSLVVTALALALPALRRFRFAVQNDETRFNVCLVLSIVPLGNFALISNAMFSQWHLLWIFFLLVAAPLRAPRSRPWRVAELIVTVLLAWSHPLTILALPLCALLLVVRPARAERLRNAVLMVTLIAYVLFGIQPADAVTALPTLSQVLTKLAVALHYISERVVFEGLVGNEARVALVSGGHHTLIHGISLTMIAALAALITIRKDAITGRGRMVFVAAGAFILCLTMAVVWTRFMGYATQAGPWSQRYFYLQQLVVVACAALAVLSASATAGRRVRVMAGLLIVAWAVTGGAQHRGYFQTSSAQSDRLLAFTADLGRRLDSADSTGWPVDGLLLRRGGKWDIRIDYYAAMRVAGRSPD